jgi:hypothetical protein
VSGADEAAVADGETGVLADGEKDGVAVGAVKPPPPWLT